MRCSPKFDILPRSTLSNSWFWSILMKRVLLSLPFTDHYIRSPWKMNHTIHNTYINPYAYAYVYALFKFRCFSTEHDFYLKCVRVKNRRLKVYFEKNCFYFFMEKESTSGHIFSVPGIKILTTKKEEKKWLDWYIAPVLASPL